MLPGNRRKRYKTEVATKRNDNYSAIINASQSESESFLNVCGTGRNRDRKSCPISDSAPRYTNTERVISPSTGNYSSKKKSDNTLNSNITDSYSSSVSTRKQSVKSPDNKPSLEQEINEIFDRQFSESTCPPTTKEHNLKRELSGLFDANFQSPRLDLTDSSLDARPKCCFSPRRKKSAKTLKRLDSKKKPRPFLPCCSSPQTESYVSTEESGLDSLTPVTDEESSVSLGSILAETESTQTNISTLSNCTEEEVDGIPAIILGYQLVDGKEEKCIMLGTVSNKDNVTIDALDQSKIQQTAVVNVKEEMPNSISKKVHFNDYVKVFSSTADSIPHSNKTEQFTVPSPRAGKTGRNCDDQSPMESISGSFTEIGKVHRFQGEASNKSPIRPKFNIPPPSTEDNEYYYDVNDEIPVPSEYYYRKRLSSSRQNRKHNRQMKHQVVKTPRPTKFEHRLLERINELEEKMDFVDPRHPLAKESTIHLTCARPLAIGRNVDNLPPAPTERSTSLRSDTESVHTPNAQPPKQILNIGRVDKPIRDFGDELQFEMFAANDGGDAEYSLQVPPNDIIKELTLFTADGDELDEYCDSRKTYEMSDICNDKPGEVVKIGIERRRRGTQLSTIGNIDVVHCHNTNQKVLENRLKESINQTKDTLVKQANRELTGHQVVSGVETCAHNETDSEYTEKVARDEDSDGYLSVYDFDAHNNVDIGCLNMQDNTGLENSINFEETSVRETKCKPLISVATKGKGPAVPRRFTIAQKFEIEDCRDIKREMKLRDARSSKMVFRKTAHAMDPGLPNRKSSRFLDPGLPNRQSSRFKQADMEAIRSTTIFRPDESVAQFLDDEEYDQLKDHTDQKSESSDFDSISESLLRNQTNSLYKELAMEIKRKSAMGNKAQMDMFVKDLISEEANESIRHFDGRLTRNERRFVQIEIANEQFDFILKNILEIVSTEALIELESDRIRTELEAQLQVEKKQKEMFRRWRDRADWYNTTEQSNPGDNKENFIPHPRTGNLQNTSIMTPSAKVASNIDMSVQIDKTPTNTIIKTEAETTFPTRKTSVLNMSETEESKVVDTKKNKNTNPRLGCSQSKI